MLTVVSARGLADEDWWGESDPFVVGDVESSTTGQVVSMIKTAVVWDTTSPKWNSGFALSTAGEMTPGDTVVFTVADFDDTTDDLLGASERFAPSCSDQGTRDLPLKMDGSQAGTLRVKVECRQESEPLLLSMVKMAAYVYNLVPSAGPWVLKASMVLDGDAVGIYQVPKPPNHTPSKTLAASLPDTAAVTLQ